MAFPSSVVSLDGFPQSEGAKIAGAAVIQGPTSYTTGGFDLEAKSLGLTAFDFVSATGSAGGAHSLIPRFTSSTTKTPLSTIKLIAIVTATGLEVANGVSLATMYFRVRAIGL